MTTTLIQQIFRAVVHVDCSFDDSNPRTVATNCDAAKDRMYVLEADAKRIAERAGVEFESLNTQVLWQGALSLESTDERKVRAVVSAIEAHVSGTEGARVLAD